MRKINWFKYGQIMRYGIDLARIFPILIKQRGTSKLISGISSHIIEAPNTFWLILLNLDLQLMSIFSGLIPRWLYELGLTNISSFRLESTIQSVLR